MRYRSVAALNRIFSNVELRTATPPNETGDRTGFPNRAFKYIYAIRRLGKRIKAWHRPTYYAVKWVLFGSIFAGIIYAPWSRVAQHTRGYVRHDQATLRPLLLDVKQVLPAQQTTDVP
jgi:hypothetical protein